MRRWLRFDGAVVVVLPSVAGLSAREPTSLTGKFKANLNASVLLAALLLLSACSGASGPGQRSALVTASGQVVTSSNPPTKAPKELWAKADLGGCTDDGCAVAVDSDRVYAADDESVYAYDARTGVIRWKAEAPENSFKMARWRDQLLVTGSSETSSSVVAYDAKTGKRSWEQPGTWVDGLTSGDSILINSSTTSDYLHIDGPTMRTRAINTVTGDLVWDAAFRVNAVCGDVAVGVSGQRVMAIESSTGNARWSKAAGPHLFSALCDSGHVVADASYQIQVLDADTGKKSWSLPTEHLQSLGIADGRLIADDDRGTVYDLGSGHVAARVSTAEWGDSLITDGSSESRPIDRALRFSADAVWSIDPKSGKAGAPFSVHTDEAFTQVTGADVVVAGASGTSLLRGPGLEVAWSAPFKIDDGREPQVWTGGGRLVVREHGASLTVYG